LQTLSTIWGLLMIIGEVHMGTGGETFGNRVTDLEIIRWRPTLFGANGQLQIDAQKHLQKLNHHQPPQLQQVRIIVLLPALSITAVVETGPVYTRFGKKNARISKVLDITRPCGSVVKVPPKGLR